MRRYLIIFLILISVRVPLSAEVNKDSLIKSIESLPSDTATVRKLVRLSDKLNTSDQGAAELVSRRAFALSAALGNKDQLFLATINLGNKLLNRGNYVEASEHLLKSLRLSETLNNPEMEAKACNSLGNLFGYQDQGDAALPYFERALAYYKKTHNKMRMEVVMTNMGNIYYSKSTYDKKYLKTAEKYFVENRTILLEMKDTVRLIANLNNIALVYSDQGKDREALALLKEAERLCASTEDSYDGIFTASYTGRAYNDLFKPDSAILFFTKSLELSWQMNNVMMKADAFINLSESYSQKKDFEHAFTYTRQYQSLHDSLMNSDNTRKIAEAQSKYEDEKKQRQIELLELSSTHQHRIYTFITWSLIAGSVLLLLLALLMYNRYALKNRSHKQLAEQNQIIAQKNKDITDSINYAKKIQDAMLPSVSTIRKAFPQSFVIYSPKDIVSGDFYWFTERQGKYFMAVVDCTGHGVPGAFMSMIGNDMLYDAIADKELSMPGEVLHSLNRHVKNSLKQNDADSGSRDGMDAAICVFEKDLSCMQYAGANRPLYLMRGGTITVYAPTKASIGGLTSTDQVFETGKFNLVKGDTIYIFSDGFCDQFGGADGKKFTTRRFRTLLEEMSGLPMPEQEKKLREAFLTWKDRTEQIDDVLVVGIRI